MTTEDPHADVVEFRPEELAGDVGVGAPEVDRAERDVDRKWLPNPLDEVEREIEPSAEVLLEIVRRPGEPDAETEPLAIGVGLGFFLGLRDGAGRG